MTIELRNNGMELWYEGRMIHSHYSNKIWTNSQVESSMQRVIDSKLPEPAREKVIRQGGSAKTQMDDYFDQYVSSIKTTLATESEKHRAALSYERLSGRLPQLDTLLNGLPLTVDQEVVDPVTGDVTVVQVPNPLREGYPDGDVMLDGLPLQIEEQLYDLDGNPTKIQMIDNPERARVQAEYDTTSAGILKTESNSAVMAIVNQRNV